MCFWVYLFMEYALYSPSVFFRMIVLQFLGDWQKRLMIYILHISANFHICGDIQRKSQSNIINEMWTWIFHRLWSGTRWAISLLVLTIYLDIVLIIRLIIYSWSRLGNTDHSLIYVKVDAKPQSHLMYPFTRQSSDTPKLQILHSRIGSHSFLQKVSFQKSFHTFWMDFIFESFIRHKHTIKGHKASLGLSLNVQWT